MRWLDRIPWWLAVLLAALVGLAPFVPEPHLVEKLRMLREGTLVRGIDVFDLAWHLAPLLLLAAKLGRTLLGRRDDGNSRNGS
jgi:hypothetical protein